MTLKRRALLPAWLICIMPVPIWLGAAALDSDILGALAALLGAWLSAIWWWSVLKQPSQMLGFLKIGAISLIAFISLGWLLSFYINIIELDQSVSKALELDYGPTTSDYAEAVVYTFCLAAVLGGMGELSFVKKLESTAVERLLSVQLVSLHNLLALLVCICALEAVLVLYGVISYRSFAVEGYKEGNIAWYIPILDYLFTTHICLNGLVMSLIMRARNRSFMIELLVLVSIFLSLFIYFTKGRSLFILCALLHGFWICFFYRKLPSLKILIVAIMFATPILYTGTLLNNFMRGHDANLGDISKIGMVSAMGQAIDSWLENESFREFEKTRSAVNLSTRPLSVSPLAESMALPANRKEFMLGENLVNSAIWSIPNAIIGDKSGYLVHEDLLYKHFPVGTQDTADSPYLFAYTDFSFAGIFIYPFIIGMMWIGSLWIARFSLIPTMGVMVIVSSWIPFFTLYMLESSLIGWFGNMRNMILAQLICIPLVWLFGLFRRIRIRR